MPDVGKGWVPLTGNLADYANASKGSFLLGDIQAFMLKDHARPGTRNQNVIHPSEMAGISWCPLSTYLRMKACREADNPYVKAPEKFPVQILNIFDEGHFIHDKWQRRLWKMGRLWGDWACYKCDAYGVEEMIPLSCPVCGSSMVKMEYCEVALFSNSHLISGHADGAVLDKNCLIEVKSVGEGTIRYSAPDIHKEYTNGDYVNLKGMFKAVQEPFPSHVNQGQIYLHLCHEMELPFTSIDFIYESKFTQGVKEFNVQYDPAIGEAFFNTAKTIVDALDNDGPLPVCPTGICKECKSYGAEIESFSTGPVERSRIESTSKALRRNPSASPGIVRSSRPGVDGAVPGSGGVERIRRVHGG